MILALALVHHLAIGNNVPLSGVARLFARMAPHAIVEFVPKEDPMTVACWRHAATSSTDYTIDGFRAAFGEPFRIVREAPLADRRAPLPARAALNLIGRCAQLLASTSLTRGP